MSPAAERRAVRPLRVLVNLCPLVPAQVGGSEEYATRLLAAVIATSEGLEVEVASMAGVRAAHPELAGPVWSEARWSGQSRPRRVAVESTWLAFRSSGFDVVHHFGGRLPAVRRGAAVLTVHDVQPLDAGANFSAVKRNYLRWALRRSARAAAVIAVPSEWTGRRVVERLGVPPERVRVVPSTYAPAFVAAPGPAPVPRPPPPRGCEPRPEPAPVARPEPSPGCEPRPAQAEPWGDEPFVLYPAATYPHKNHRLLIAACAAARSRCGGLTLVLTGGAGRAHRAVAELVARTPGVVHLGRVDEARLAGLFSAAAALVFPSRYEGFGLPVLEAMAAGTPVIAARAGALPEMAAGAGALVDPDDFDGWVDALLEARDGSPQIRRRVEEGRARASRYAPPRVARRLLAAWRAAAGQDAAGADAAEGGQDAAGADAAEGGLDDAGADGGQDDDAGGGGQPG